MNKKIKQAVSLLLLCAMACVLFACTSDQPQVNPDCTEHVDADNDLKCDICQRVLDKKTDCKIHTDADGDGKCDACGEAVKTPVPPTCTEHEDANGDGRCDSCGEDVGQEETVTTSAETFESSVTAETTEVTESTETTEETEMTDEAETTENAETTQKTESTKTTENTEITDNTETTENIDKTETTENTETTDKTETTENSETTETTETESATEPETDPDPNAEYTLKFESQGKIVGTIKIKNGEAFAVPTLERGDEYILLGWKDKATGKKITESIFNWTEDVTLVAIWDTVWSEGF